MFVGVAARLSFVVLLAHLALPQPRSITRVAWLTGCWESRSAQRVIEEQWMAPRAGTMLGMSRTTRGDSLIESEQVLLREHGARLLYEAHPSGQAAAVFTSTVITDSIVVFENLQHDFPQRVGYHRMGSDSLMAYIEGEINGRARRVNFLYGRVGCLLAPRDAIGSTTQLDPVPWSLLRFTSPRVPEQATIQL